MSTDTWTPDAGLSVSATELVAWLDGLPGELTGLTVSGGEPFQQPAALAAFLGATREWSAAAGRAIDIMVYSGYTGAALRRSRARTDALQFCDVVVTGPYVRSRAPGGSWRGSANQRLEVLTDLGRRRFGPDPDRQPWQPGLQTVVEDGRWWLVGVPGPGQLERLERELAGRGVDLSEVSWDRPE
jgi:anaerobic ribonucleoside-triphosphate reductase activating protein